MSEWQLVLVAVITSIASIVSPVILSIITIRARRKDRQEDWARQDQVAKKLAETAKSSVAATNGKLDVIHKLVNSNMTAAMQDSLDSTLRERAALIELREYRLDLGKEPTEDTLTAIALADAKIAELLAILADRKS